MPDKQKSSSAVNLHKQRAMGKENKIGPAKSMAPKSKGAKN